MPEVRLHMEWESEVRILGVGTNLDFRPRWQSPDLPAPTVVTADQQGGSGWILTADGEDEPVKNPDKPAYQLPSMAEIGAIPHNGLRAASTFSGCGGSSLGYRMAGFEVLWASEFIPAARDTYRANFPGTHIDERDIREVHPDEILERTGLARGDLDLLDGSPPCAAFSTAGKREKTWGRVRAYSESHQRVDDLFFEYARLLEGLQPKVCVAENVSGLVKGSSKGYFLEILARLKACGYRVRAKVLDAQWLGVPQARQRLIFIGVRSDLGRDPVFPDPLPYRYSVRDALPWITKVTHDTSGQYGAGEVTDRPCPAVTVGFNSVNSLHFKVEAETDISRYAIGREWERLRQGEKGRYFNLVKPRLDAPCPTITQTGKIIGAASVVHPTEKRKFSIPELRRICGFPDDFILTGSYAQQWERLGRAVPPPMMFHIAQTIRDGVLQEDAS